MIGVRFKVHQHLRQKLGSTMNTPDILAVGEDICAHEVVLAAEMEARAGAHAGAETKLAGKGEGEGESLFREACDKPGAPYTTWYRRHRGTASTTSTADKTSGAGDNEIQHTGSKSV